MWPKKKSNKSFTVLSSRGQATIEYILILVVSVGIILAFSKRFSKPFGEYLNSYFGGYFSCLLDKGVLPKLGAEDDDCSDAFQLSSDNPFSKSNAQKGNTDQGKAQGASASQPSEINEMSNSRSGNNGGRTIGQLPRRSDPAPRAADGATKDSKVTSIPNPDSESNFYKISNFGEAGGGRKKLIQLSGLSRLANADRERLKRRAQRVTKVGVVDDGDSSNRGKKLIIKPPQRKFAVEAESEPMTFGKFVRLLIILAIILAIVVFLGTQMNQISKSWEK